MRLINRCSNGSVRSSRRRQTSTGIFASRAISSAQRLVEQFPVQPPGEFFADGAAARAKFPVNEKDLFHGITISFRQRHGVDLPGLFKNEHAQNAHRAEAGHDVEHIHERPIAGLLKHRVIKQIAPPRQGVSRIETHARIIFARIPGVAGIAGFSGDNCPTIMADAPANSVAAWWKHRKGRRCRRCCGPDSGGRWRFRSVRCARCRWRSSSKAQRCRDWQNRR